MREREKLKERERVKGLPMLKVIKFAFRERDEDETRGKIPSFSLLIYKRTDVNEANSHSESVQEQTTAIKVAPICDRDTIGWSELIDGTS